MKNVLHILSTLVSYSHTSKKQKATKKEKFKGRFTRINKVGWYERHIGRPLGELIYGNGNWIS